MISTKAITVRVDGSTKEQAERMLDDMGMNMTTFIESEREANDPNTQWLSHDEVFGPLREKNMAMKLHRILYSKMDAEWHLRG